MARVQAGQPERFAELIGRYQSPLLRVARSRLGRSDWAEDVVQETFLAAFKSRHTYRMEFSFRTWLWTILLNQCRGHFQRQGRQPQVVFSVDAGSEQTPLASGEATDEPLPLANLLAQERAERLELFLSRINPDQADALRLRFFGGLKFQEIADAMGCSLGTAKNRVQWGLTRLSALMREEEDVQRNQDIQSNPSSDRLRRER